MNISPVRVVFACLFFSDETIYLRAHSDNGTRETTNKQKDEPILVEATLDGLGQMFSPDGGQRAKTTGGLDISDQANDVDGRSLQDGDGFDNFVLVGLRARLVDFTEDVSHTGLVAHKGSQAARLGLVILGEGPDATTVVLGSATRQKSKRSGTGVFELTMRHGYCGERSDKAEKKQNK